MWYQYIFCYFTDTVQCKICGDSEYQPGVGIVLLNTEIKLMLIHKPSFYWVRAAEATGLGFVCVINPRVLLANRVDFWAFFIS